MTVITAKEAKESLIEKKAEENSELNFFFRRVQEAIDSGQNDFKYYENLSTETLSYLRDDLGYRISWNSLLLYYEVFIMGTIDR